MAVSFNDITNMANVMSSAGARYNAAQDARARTGLASRGLALDERKQQFTEQAALIERAKADLANLSAQMREIATSGARDIDPDRAEKAISVLGNAQRRLYMAAGADESTAQQLVNANIEQALSTPTRVQEGRIAGEAKGAGTAAEAEADPRTAAQRDADLAGTRAGTAATNALTAQRQQEMATGVMNMVNTTTGQTIGIPLASPRAQELIAAATNDGFVQMGAPTIQATSARDLGGVPESKAFAGAPQRAAVQGEIQAYDTALSGLDRILADAEENPSRYGGMGSMRAGAETIGSILGDAASMLNMEGQAALAGDIVAELKEFAGLGENSEFESIAASDPIRANIVYALARSRQPTGKLLASTIELAQNDVKLRGFTGSDQVVSKLKEIRDQIATGRSDAIGRLQTMEGGGKVDVSQPVSRETPKEKPKALSEIKTEDLSKMSDEELRAIIAGGS